MSEQKPSRWKAFTSLDWYDGTIEFLFRFVAKTSEPLLAAGIVYSAADVLSKGHLGSANPIMDNLWAISQALAIESSGGVVLVYGLQSVKEKDHVKAWMYFILSALLAITGGVMLYMQLAGLENQQADSPLMRGLFALRCVVSVGYIYLCRTKAISFRNLDGQPAATPDPEPTTPAPIQEQQPTPEPIDYQRLAQELAPLLQAVRTTIIEEVKASITGPESTALPERRGDIRRNPLFLETGKAEPSTLTTRELPTPEKLERAYQQLVQANNGQRVSGRALAKQAHVDRQTCLTWLKIVHPEQAPMPSATARETTTSPQPEVVATASEPTTTNRAEMDAATNDAAIDHSPETDATAREMDTSHRSEVDATATEADVTAREVAAANQPGADFTVTGNQSEADVAATATATLGQLDVDTTASETATPSRSEVDVATSEPITRSRPRKKTAATTIRKAAQPRKKATTTSQRQSNRN